MQIKTTLLKIVTAGIDAFLLLFCFMLTLGLFSSIQSHSMVHFQLLTIISLYVTCLVVFVISFYLFRIFRLIDKHDFFTKKALHFVRIVRYLFTAASVTLAGILPFIVITAHQGGAPGIILLALAFVLFPLAISAFVSVMEKILINSIKFKQENELTI
ncbi:DUF2975 domain-containing protein [Companilactobacillus huachuanensis]|uniref:DUF2975 domain-containing protein n=1 Tax=Companilactobacillus huachuanensis TaxID=2559914 RepID=A0ABW1RKA6_9LACO|nr:DUF2975 domain-containing protein [Companilactobacillus huachuanensis]